MRTLVLLSFLLLSNPGFVTSQLATLSNIISLVLTNPNLIQTLPELGLGVADVFNFVNSTGNLTGGIDALFANQGLNTLASTAVTLLFESFSIGTLTNNGVSEGCQKNVIIFIEELFAGNPWTLRMLDASGKLGPDLADGQTKFLGSFEECEANLVSPVLDASGKLGSDLADGQTKFLGSFEECEAIRAVAYTTDGAGVQRERSSFSGKYCSIQFEVPGIPYEITFAGAGYLQVGICMPDTCSGRDLELLASMLERLLFNRTVLYTPHGDCQEGRDRVGGGVIVAIIVLTVLGGLVIIGTLYDAVAVQMKSSNKSEEKSEPVLLTENIYRISDNKLSIDNDINKRQEDPEVKSPEQSDLNGKSDPLDLNGSFTKPGANGKLDPLDFNGKLDVNHDSENGSLTPLQNKLDFPEKNGLERAMLAFSAYTNGLKILNTDHDDGSFGALHGMRFLTMAWVIFCHVHYYARGYDANFANYLYVKKDKQWTFMVIYGDIAVDTFFAISGVMITYMTLKKLKEVGGPKKLNWLVHYFYRFWSGVMITYMTLKKLKEVGGPKKLNWLVHYFYRFWRLTPTYMLVLMFGTAILPYIMFGPLWNHHDAPYMEKCRENWWANLLYINNYVKAEERMCMMWTWYLAADMQYFWISPLLILPLYFNVILGVVICLLPLAAVLVVTGIISHDHTYLAQLYSIAYLNAPDRDYYEVLYYPSHTRMGPYIIGTLTGYLLYRWKCKCNISRLTNFAGWFVAIGLTAVVVYGRYDDEGAHLFSTIESDIFNASHRTVWAVAVCWIIFSCATGHGESDIFNDTHRTVWAVAVCWIIFSCATGHGGFINTLLSWEPFKVLSKLTFCAFLINPLVILTFYSSRMVTSYFTDFEVIYLFLSNLVFTYGLSFVISLACQTPMLGLEKIFFSRWRKQLARQTE